MASRRKGKKGGNRRSSQHIQTLSPQGYEGMMRRTGLVFNPTVVPPTVIIAALQYLMRGGFDGSGTLDDAIRRHFGEDGAGYKHWADFLRNFFNFRVKTPAVHLVIGILISTVLVLRYLLGDEGGWRMWNALWDASNSDQRVDMDPREPVASLVYIKDKADYDQGYDQHFGSYGDLVYYTLERNADRKRVDVYLQHASQGSPYHRQVAYMAAQLLDGEVYTSPYGKSRSLRRVASGGAMESHELAYPVSIYRYGERIGGSLFGRMVTENKHLHVPVTPPPVAVGGTSAYKPTAAQEWAGMLQTLRELEIAQPGQWPVRNGSARDIDALHPVQRFGAWRPLAGSGGKYHHHTGLDIPGDKGDEVVAAYGGRVIKAVSSGGGSRGNYVRIAYGNPALGNQRLVLDYMHLDRLPEGLNVGDTVGRGETIGYLGNTGNSNAPHLHIEAHLERNDVRHGRPTDARLLDVEELLQEGAIEAAKSAGASILPATPSMGAGAWLLEAAASGRAVPPSGYAMGGGLLTWLDDITNKFAAGLRELINDQQEGLYEELRGGIIKGTGKVLDIAEDNKSWLADLFGLALPGVGDDVLESLITGIAKGWEAGEGSNFDSQTMFEAGMRAAVPTLQQLGGVSDEDKRRALRLLRDQVGARGHDEVNEALRALVPTGGPNPDDNNDDDNE